MSIGDSMRDDYKNDEIHRKKWVLGDYVDESCPKCGRQRLCKCPNGKHRCEKCNWCPEDRVYVNAR